MPTRKHMRAMLLLLLAALTFLAAGLHGNSFCVSPWIESTFNQGPNGDH